MLIFAGSAHPGLEFPRESRRWTRAEGSAHDNHSLRGPAHNFREVQEGYPDRGVDAVEAMVMVMVMVIHTQRRAERPAENVGR